MKSLLVTFYHEIIHIFESIATYFNCIRSGIGYDSSWVVKGMPVFMFPNHLKFKPSRRGLSIGKNFTCINKFDSNSIGLIQSCLFNIPSEGKHIRIGDNVGISGSSLCAVEDITIGNNVLIGSGCIITTTDSHPIHWEARRHNTEQPASAPVVIEDDVFLGARCIILKGVTIGAGAVIGAGSVVTKDIPPRVIAAGNPARVVKSI